MTLDGLRPQLQRLPAQRLWTSTRRPTQNSDDGAPKPDRDGDSDRNSYHHPDCNSYVWHARQLLPAPRWPGSSSQESGQERASLAEQSNLAIRRYGAAVSRCFRTAALSSFECHGSMVHCAGVDEAMR